MKYKSFKEYKQEIISDNKIIVEKISLSENSKCEFCDSHDEYGIFIGGTKLSDLHHWCCSNHLSKAIEDSILVRNNRINKTIEELKKLIANEHLEIHKS